MRKPDGRRVAFGSSRRSRRAARRAKKPPDFPYIGLDQVKRLVLDAVSSPSTRLLYAKALDDFFGWREEQGRPPFSPAAVQAHRAFLESKG
jgi:hypothetical protein